MQPSINEVRMLKAAETTLRASQSESKVRLISSYLKLLQRAKYRKLIQVTEPMEMQQLTGELRLLDELIDVTALVTTDPVLQDIQTILH